MTRYVSFLIFIVTIFITTLSYSNNKYNVNFNNVPMKDFITFVSEFTGKNVIFNEADIRGNVTVNSQKEMDEKEVLDVFYSVLKMNGYIPVTNGNTIQIILEKDVPTYDEKFSTNGKDKNESYVTSVITLRHYNAPTLLPILNRMKSRTGYVDAVRGLNIIVVKDLTSRIDKMTSLIKRLDVAANGYKFYSISLQYALASKVEQQVVKLYGEMGKNALTTTVPVVISDDVSNSLIIAATEKEYERIKYLVDTFDSKSTVENTAPKVFYLKNAKAEDVEKVLLKVINSISPNQQQNQNKAASNIKANISADKSTNSIIAIGDQELYVNLASLIEKMDIPRRQVYVESLILESSLDESKEFGVDWYGGGHTNNTTIIGSANNNAGLSGLVGAAVGGAATATMPQGFSLGVIGDMISYNGMQFPSIGAFMSAITGVSGIGIVSNPQILTLDNEEAEVFVGENRPYLTSEKQDANNNPIQTFDYRDVGVKLKITPQISSSDSIVLTVEQEVKKMMETSNTTSPTTLSRNTKTVVKLQNKSIMVISGLIKNDITTGETGVPGLSKIPLFGWLFKKKTYRNEQTNLTMFISATIIDTVADAEALMKLRKDSLNDFTQEADDALGSKVFHKMQDDIEMLNKNKHKNEEKKDTKYKEEIKR